MRALRAKIALVLHQSKSVRDLLSSLLKELPISAVLATTEREAKRLFSELQPELVIVGLTSEWVPLLESFRSEQPSLQVIVLTRSDELAQEARRVGFDNVLIEEGPESLAEGIQCFLGDWLTIPSRTDEITILVVDDEVEICNALSDHLVSRRYPVLSTQTGKMALQIVERHPSVSIVVLDLVMPEMGGMETLKALRGLVSNLGVIVMSDFADREIVRQALRLGAFDVLLKPVDLNQLEGDISAWLASLEFHKKSWWKWRTAASG